MSGHVIPTFDKSWSLFLDRDGVINRRLPGRYVTHFAEFEYLPDSLQSIAQLNKIFGRIFIVTNQKGVGKGLMTQTDLDEIHLKIISDFKKAGGYIDAVYAATAARLTSTSQHKPNPGMAIQAKTSFPEIDFKKSVIVGDSISDMQFGLSLGMWTVLVEGKKEEVEMATKLEVDQRVKSLGEWTSSLNFFKSFCHF